MVLLFILLDVLCQLFLLSALAMSELYNIWHQMWCLCLLLVKLRSINLGSFSFKLND